MKKSMHVKHAWIFNAISYFIQGLISIVHTHIWYVTQYQEVLHSLSILYHQHTEYSER